MAALKKSLVDKINDRIVDGENPVDLSKEVGLPLEDVLAVVHEIYGKTFPTHGAFTREQSEYLRHCLEYGVPNSAIGRMLGVEVKPSVLVVASNHTPGENGNQRSIPKLGGTLDEDSMVSEARGNAYDVEANRITLYGAITADHAKLKLLDPLFDSARYDVILQSDNKAVSGEKDRDMEEAIGVMINISRRIIDNSTNYSSNSEGELLGHFKEAMNEMKDDAEDFLIKAANIVGNPKKSKTKTA